MLDWDLLISVHPVALLALSLGLLLASRVLFAVLRVVAIVGVLLAATWLLGGPMLGENPLPIVNAQETSADPTGQGVVWEIARKAVLTIPSIPEVAAEKIAELR